MADSPSPLPCLPSIPSSPQHSCPRTLLCQHNQCRHVVHSGGAGGCLPPGFLGTGVLVPPPVTLHSCVLPSLMILPDPLPRVWFPFPCFTTVTAQGSSYGPPSLSPSLSPSISPPMTHPTAKLMLLSPLSQLLHQALLSVSPICVFQLPNLQLLLLGPFPSVHLLVSCLPCCFLACLWPCRVSSPKLWPSRTTPHCCCLPLTWHRPARSTLLGSTMSPGLAAAPHLPGGEDLSVESQGGH